MESAWAGVAVTAVTLAWAVTAWVLSRALARARTEGSLSARLDTIARDLDRLVADKDRTHAELAGQLRDDRAATDRRLRWLETHVWAERQKGT